jgi:DNA (cytosine-5)-methyltransferase 1
MPNRVEVEGAGPKIGHDSASLGSCFELRGERLFRELTAGDRRYRSSLAVSAPSGDDLGDWWSAILRGERPRAEGSIRRREVRVVDLFCGPGGLASGFQQACDELGLDMVAAAAVDQDAEAVDVYAANHGVRRKSAESVSALVDFQVAGSGARSRFVYEPEVLFESWADLVGTTDVILAGPPCQGHSNLNNRTRRVDRRNELYLTVPAMAIALGARVVVIENVPAVVHDRQQVVAATEALLRSAGYEVTTGTLSAAKLGWPQSRQRFFLVARLGAKPIPLATVSEAFADQPRTVSWAIRDLADAPFDELMHLRTELSDENQRRIDYLFDNDLHDLPPSERPDCHKDGTTYNAVYGRLHGDRPAPTITTGFLTPGRGRYIHPTRRRVLTPREAARIQGFPDTYRFHVSMNALASKQKLAKWIGDAVPLPLGHAAGLSALASQPLDE